MSVVPTAGQDVTAGRDVTAKGRTRTQVIRCGLKFLCATGKVDLMQNSGVELDAFVLALGGLENRVSNSLDAFVEAKDESQFVVVKVKGNLCILICPQVTFLSSMSHGFLTRASSSYLNHLVMTWRMLYKNGFKDFVLLALLRIALQRLRCQLMATHP